MSVGVAVVLVVVAAGFARPHAAAAVAQFYEQPIATIAYGTRPEQMAVAECGDCGDESCSGFAFLDERDDIYVYDVPANALKVLRFKNGKALSIQVVRGPVLEAQNEHPYDGCVSPDGTVYLLADRATLRGRYLVFARGARDSAWSRAEPLDDETLGWAALNGHRQQVVQAARIDVEPDGTVAVYDLDRRSSGAVVVARGDRFVPTSARVRLPAGLRGRSGLIARARARGLATELHVGEDPVATARVAIPGAFLGMDDAGNTYQATYGTGNVYEFQRYDRAGTLTASSPVPRRRITKLVLGKGHLLMGRLGDVFQFRFTDAGLVITRWTAPE
ncbi:MAG: hypothetical protein HZC42_12795 [Candidatus Eisenbacteria bacterium]|nr:hypothetical protein [Candidatus Eisenbacteria bacterium]